jgi:hypothetical protein
MGHRQQDIKNTALVIIAWLTAIALGYIVFTKLKLLSH